MGLQDHSRKTRDVISRLLAEGWYEARKGPVIMCSTGIRRGRAE
jgi:hypothetical protein